MTTWRLYGSTSGPSSSQSDTTDYVMGVSFKVTSPGLFLAGFGWWVADANQDNTARNYALWQPSGPAAGTLISGSAILGAAGLALGWNLTTYGSPLPLTANTEYRAVRDIGASSGFGGGYSATPNFWDTGPGAGGLTVGPLTAYSAAGEPADGKQMVFTAIGNDVTLDYPSTEFNNTNYWLDPIITDGGGPVNHGSFLPFFG